MCISWVVVLGASRYGVCLPLSGLLCVVLCFCFACFRCVSFAFLFVFPRVIVLFVVACPLVVFRVSPSLSLFVSVPSCILSITSVSSPRKCCCSFSSLLGVAGGSFSFVGFLCLASVVFLCRYFTQLELLIFFPKLS